MAGADAGRRPEFGDGRGDGGEKGPTERRSVGGALAVAAGIFASRVSGLLRTSVLGSIFGVGPHADVLSAALRLPNLVQNLLGEQTLSASFIPVYSRLLGEGRREEAGRFAGAVFSLLVAVAGGLAFAGVLLARPLVALFATGFLRDRALVAQGLATVDRFPLAVAAVQWIFPMTALLVLSAWALGILNSHGRFFLSYAAPVAWNGAILGAAFWAARGAHASAEALLRATCIGAFAGGLLQFLIQIPGVIRSLEGWSFRIGPSREPVRRAVRAFVPMLAGRGVVQLSSYLDQILASLLVAGAISALAYAQTLYLLPVSLFGLSIAAAALPELARRSASAGGPGHEGTAPAVRAALVQTSFLNLPTAVAYLLLGGPLVQGVFRLFGGRFGAQETALVTATLGAYALGLPAATSSRVIQSGLYAGGETRAPAKIAVLRVGVSLVVGVPLMFWLDRWSMARFGFGELAGAAPALRMGAVGLALAASVAAWIELVALQRAAGERWSVERWPWREPARYAALGLVASLPAALFAYSAPARSLHATVRAAITVLLFVTMYLLLARREEPARALVRRLRRPR